MGTRSKETSAANFDRDLPLAFSSTVLVELATKGRASFIKHLMKELNLRPRTYADFFEACHSRMWERYRSEYVYKNAIASKILMGRHSVSTTRFFSEFRTENAKADVVLINGTSTVYEIKTELDNLDRLPDQLRAYRNVFDKVYVVTHSSIVDEVLEAADDRAGVLVLRDDYSFREVRKASSNRNEIVPSSVFDSLRRAEYCQIIQQQFGYVPDVPNAKIYAACRELFCQLPPTIVHDGMVSALHARKPPQAVLDLAVMVPPSLRAASLTAELSEANAKKLTQALSIVPS